MDTSFNRDRSVDEVWGFHANEFGAENRKAAMYATSFRLLEAAGGFEPPYKRLCRPSPYHLAKPPLFW